MFRIVFLLLFLSPLILFAQRPMLSDSVRGYIVEDTSTYTYEMIAADLDSFQKSYPDVVHPVHIGKSEFGLDLKAVRIGRDKPKQSCIFLVGNVHAREDFSSKLVMKFLNGWLLSIDHGSTIYPDAAAYLDSIDIYILPVANPDGLKIAQYDFDGILDSVNAHLDSIYCVEGFPEWKANGRGIDLNRSFDDGNWNVKASGGFQPRPSSEGYKGEIPAQPLETRAIQDFVNRVRPLITVSFHTKGEVLYWADAKSHPYFQNVDKQISERVADSSGYELSAIGKNPASYGCGLENYVRLRLGRLGTCVELAPGTGGRTPHADNLFNTLVWDKAWQIPAIYIRSAVEFQAAIETNAEALLKGLAQ